MLLARSLPGVLGEGQLTIIDAAGRPHRIEGARPGPAVTLRVHSWWTGVRAGAAPPPGAGRSLHGRHADRRGGRRHLRPARSPGPQHRGAGSDADGALVLRLAALAARARAVQSGRQGAAQRRAPLRPQRPALRPLPRPRPAVFLRLLQDRRRAAGAGPARQEAPHRRQAAAAARPEACSTSARAGAAWACSSPAVRRRRDRRHALQGAARRFQPARAGGRRGRPCALQAARLSPGSRPLRPHRLGRHVRACRRRALRRVLHAR